MSWPQGFCQIHISRTRIRGSDMKSKQEILTRLKELTDAAKQKIKHTVYLLIPAKEDDRSVKISKMIMLGTLVVLVGATTVLISYIHSRGQALETLKDIQNDYVIGGEVNPGTSDKPDESDDNSSNDGINDQGEDTQETTVNVNDPIDFDRLLETNSDVVGWLRIQGLTLSTPVVQGVDNAYYLETNLYGENDRYGVPFADYRNSFAEDLLSSNTIIYGHHMRGGKLFGELTRYKNQDFYEQHPIIRFETPTRKMDWLVIGAFIEEIKGDGNYFHYHNFIEAQEAGDIVRYAADIQARSLIDTGIIITEQDKLLTLSTCTYEYDDARFVLVAKLMQ